MVTDSENPNLVPEPHSLLDKTIWFCLNNKLVVLLMVIVILVWGAMVAPFDWDLGSLPRDPVPVDAIPDIGENQQIVFTQWMGRSPQDVEDQIGYPLTVALLGLPEVKTIRSYSMFGFSTIYVIFNEKAEFYWSRTRVLEKLNSLPTGTLPEGVQPTLGPDATALGQIFWYTLEGYDPDGNVVGGWDLHELRTTQDWYVRYALNSAEGISEVASIGGFVQEYQIDVDPDAMRANKVSLGEVFNAVRMTNVDVGARTIELNKAEYVVRGLGFIKQVEDLEKTVLKVHDNVPITIKDVAKVTLGPALRRGALDKEGAEVVGGVCVVRYGYNPLEAIKNVKKMIAEGLPSKVLIDFKKTTRKEITQYAKSHSFDAYENDLLNNKAWVQHLRSLDRNKRPEWATISQITVVPFYDRTGLIYETLGTLNTALTEEILVTIIVILISVMHLRSSVLISALLPLAVLMCFIGMKTFGVDANIVALSGIAIAIGTMVDMGIILCENILKHLEEADPEEDRLKVIFNASREVAGAVLTAVSTTIISFLPVFTMIGAEGKLFKPLAFTKTFALIASVIVALTIIPPVAHVLFTGRLRSEALRRYLHWSVIIVGMVTLLLAILAAMPMSSDSSITYFSIPWWVGAIVMALGTYKLLESRIPKSLHQFGPWSANGVAVVVVGLILTDHWLPLGPDKGFVRNLIFVVLLIGGLLAFFQIFQRFIYEPLLRWCLRNKALFLMIPIVILMLGSCVWLGFDRVFGFFPAPIRNSTPWKAVANTLPGLGKEFMPPLDEGSFLYMPTTMPHASIGEAMCCRQGRPCGQSA